MENLNPNEQAAITNSLLEKVKNSITQNYQPIKTYENNVILLSTEEIYCALQKIYPTQEFYIENVAEWLDAAGFTFIDAGNLRLEWMLQKVN